MIHDLFCLLKYVLRVCQHLFVCESYNLIAKRFKISCSLFVRDDLVANEVITPIHLYNQLFGKAYKIRNILANQMLSSEFCPQTVPF